MPVLLDGLSAASRPLHDVAATRVLEARARSGLGESALMRRAGSSVARLAQALAPHARHVLVACGPGGNGGDGLHAAAELAQRGRVVSVWLAADPLRLPPEARQGLERAREAGCRFITDFPVAAHDLAIDALLGIGSNRAPQGQLLSAVQALNTLTAPCLSVDLPTGLDALTGVAREGATVRARATLSLLACKPGLHTGAGRDFAGDVWFDDLGIDIALAPTPCARLAGREDLDCALPARPHAGHKGSFGDVLVIGGARGMGGAARLAAHAALAAGPGRTLLSLLDPEAAPAASERPEWLRSEQAWLPGRVELERATVVCGCGGGTAVQTAMPAVLARARRLVLDADALNAVARDDALRAQLTARSGRERPTVLTPHPLEAARLLRSTTAAVQADRLGAARALAQELRCTVALKGSGTVVASSGGHLPVVNGTGSAALASGGTGDVLAGWIGGSWAQTAADPARPDTDGRAATVAAVWLHGAAGQAAGPLAVRARDLVDGMRELAAQAARRRVPER